MQVLKRVPYSRLITPRLYGCTSLCKVPVCVAQKRFIAYDHSRFLALHTAVRLGQVDIVRGLIEKGAVNLNSVSDEHKNTPLAAAVEGGHKDLVRMLLVNGADVNAWVREDGNTLLHEAIEKGFNDIATFLIQFGAKLNVLNKRGIPPLLVAVKHGNLTILQALIKEGAKVSAIGAGEHPLTVAAREGHVEIARELANNGANFQDAINKETLETPCHVAAANGHAPMLRFLLQLPHSSQSPRQDGLTPLHLAAQNGQANAVRALLEVGKDLDANFPDKRGRTALYHAVQSGSEPAVRDLIAYGASPNNTAIDDQTPLSLAKKNGDKVIIDLLTGKKA